MKKVLLLLLVLCFIPSIVYARTEIDIYGHEYEVVDTKPADFSEDDIAEEHNVTSFATTTVTRNTEIEIQKQKKEEKIENKKRNRKYISYGVIAILFILVVIVGLLFLIKVTRTANLY